MEISSLSELEANVGNRVSIEGLVIVSIEGDIFDPLTAAKILVTDGESSTVLLLPETLKQSERLALAKQLEYPIAGDILDISFALVKQDTEIFIELCDPSEVYNVTPAPAEIDFGDCTPIAAITGAGNYKSRGKVVARSNTQFILQDETGAILVYSNYAASLEIGKCYQIKGEVVIYARGLEYKNISAPTPIDDLAGIEPCEPLIMQTAFLDPFVLYLERVPCTYIEYYGKLIKSGNYNNLNLPYTDNVKVSVNTSIDLTDYYNQYVVITGWLTGANGGSPYYLQTVVDSIRLASAQPAKPTEIQIVGCDGQLEPRSKTLLSVKFLTDADVEKEITWSVSDERVASIDAYGWLTCHKPGTFTVTATTSNGVTASMEIECRLTQKINPEKVITTLPEIAFDVGETYFFTPELYPENTNNFAYISYEIAAPSIASVSEDGEVTALAYGSTLLRVKLAGGNTALVPIYVEPYYDYGNNVQGANERTDYQTVTSLDQLKAVFLDASLNGYRTIYVDFELTEPLHIESILYQSEHEYLSKGLGIRVMEGQSGDVFLDQKVRFRFNGWAEDHAKGPYHILTDINASINIPDAAVLLHQQLVSQSPYRRGDDFEDFPITLNNQGTVHVYNVTQLLWALERNYLPTFPLENSKAEQIYQASKQILRTIITEDMTDMERCFAIFNYICANTAYATDYMLAGNTNSAPEQSIIGMIDRGRTVCEGYSEAFMLLARMEGIEAYRASGGNHAWNYVVVNGKYYLVDTQVSDLSSPTPEGWRQADDLGGNLGWHGYSLFMDTNKTYMANKPHNSMPADVEFSSITDEELDQLMEKGYDFVIKDRNELAAIMKAVVALDIQERFYLTLCDDGVGFMDDWKMQQALKNAGFDGEYIVEVSTAAENTRNYYTFIFCPNTK